VDRKGITRSMPRCLNLPHREFGRCRNPSRRFACRGSSREVP
jgi:hypothetical protein